MKQEVVMNVAVMEIEMVKKGSWRKRRTVKEKVVVKI